MFGGVCEMQNKGKLSQRRIGLGLGGGGVEVEI